MGIVKVSLLLIAQNLVRLGNFLELDFGFLSLLLGDLVGVVFQSGLKGYQDQPIHGVGSWIICHLQEA